jgi:hypothetical protein
MFVASVNQQPARLRSTSYAGHASPFGSVAAPRVARRAKRGGARRDRTDDLMLAKHALSQLSYGPVPEDEYFTSAVETHLVEEKTHSIKVVGLGRLELPTSRLSSARSNQLSYKPLTLILKMRIRVLLARIGKRRMHRTSAKPPARVRPRRKRNEDGEIPPMELNNPEIAGP